MNPRSSDAKNQPDCDSGYKPSGDLTTLLFLSRLLRLQSSTAFELSVLTPISPTRSVIFIAWLHRMRFFRNVCKINWEAPADNEALLGSTLGRMRHLEAECDNTAQLLDFYEHLIKEGGLRNPGTPHDQRCCWYSFSELTAVRSENQNFTFGTGKLWPKNVFLLRMLRQALLYRPKVSMLRIGHLDCFCIKRQLR